MCVRVHLTQTRHAQKACAEMRINMKAIIFDMDGVLFDTETVCLNAWIEVANNNHLSGMEKVFPKCIGLNVTDTETVMKEAYGADVDFPELKRQMSEAFWRYIERNGQPEKPGVHEILEWLKKAHYKVGLASSTRRASILKHLEDAGIAEYFEVVVAGDMVEHSKPNPDIYLLACKEMGVEPAEAYAVEDSFNGIRSAYAAGMKPLMVPDMLTPNEEMREKSAGIFESLGEVLKFLQTTE